MSSMNVTGFQAPKNAKPPATSSAAARLAQMKQLTGTAAEKLKTPTETFVPTTAPSPPEAQAKQVEEPVAPPSPATVDQESAQVAEPVLEKTSGPPVSNYQSPEGTSGPLIMEMEQPALGVGLPEAPSDQSYNTTVRANAVEAANDSFRAHPQGRFAALADTLGVKANARTGESYDKTLSGDDSRLQKAEWRMGQAVDLVNQDRRDLAVEVLDGWHDKMEGKSVYAPLVREEQQRDTFTGHYKRHGWEITNSYRVTIADLGGANIAFLHEGKDGKLEEVRGRVTPMGRGLATIKVSGREEEFNLNDVKDFAFTRRDASNTPGAPKVAVSAVPTLEPKQEFDSYQKLLGLASSVRSASTNGAAGLLKLSGVTPGQRTGEDFNTELRGKEADAQQLEWRLGQAAELIADGRKDSANEVLMGKYDMREGHGVKELVEKNETFARQFEVKHKDSGWEVFRRSNVFYEPRDMAGHEVAFMLRDEKTGELTEHQGKLEFDQGGRRGNAIFSLEGSDREFSSNDVIGMRVNPQKQGALGKIGGWLSNF